MLTIVTVESLHLSKADKSCIKIRKGKGFPDLENAFLLEAWDLEKKISRGLESLKCFFPEAWDLEKPLKVGRGDKRVYCVRDS